MQFFTRLLHTTTAGKNWLVAFVQCDIVFQSLCPVILSTNTVLSMCLKQKLCTHCRKRKKSTLGCVNSRPWRRICLGRGCPKGHTPWCLFSQSCTQPFKISKIYTIGATQGARGDTVAFFNHSNYDADLMMGRGVIGDDSRSAENSTRDPFNDTIHVFSVWPLMVLLKLLMALKRSLGRKLKLQRVWDIFRRQNSKNSV